MIYIIRHGQTEQNNRKLLAGHGDYLLNQAGIDQAMEAGRWFASRSIRFDEVYSSPLRRALDTADYVAPGIPVTIDNRLIEMCFGPYEGMDLTKPLPEVVTFFQDFEHNPAPEGMETLASVTARLGSLLEELKEKADRNILLSTHAIAMKGALTWLNRGCGESFWPKFIDNCAVYTTEPGRDGVYTPPVQIR